MALYASHEGNYIFAPDASANKHYECPECFGSVKVRRGSCRIPHFYHVKKSPGCRLYNKSEEHAVLQLELQKMLPPGAAILERQFSSIRRIADVCWEEKKIIYEIQCSPISRQEAHDRIKDYQSLGYHVLWILSDRTYNQAIVREAEELVRSSHAYFFSPTKSKETFIYDQLEILRNKKRLKKSPPFRVNPCLPLLFSQDEQIDKLPRPIKNRIVSSNHYFAGDLIDQWLKRGKSQAVEGTFRFWELLEERFQEHSTHEKPPSLLQKLFIRPYIQFLDGWIERISRG